MLPVLRFSIRYADGGRVEGADAADWEAAPADGVLAVVFWHEAPYRTLAYSEEPYRYPGSGHVKWGQEIESTAWRRFLEALHDERHPLA